MHRAEPRRWAFMRIPDDMLTNPPSTGMPIPTIVPRFADGLRPDPTVIEPHRKLACSETAMGREGAQRAHGPPSASPLRNLPDNQKRTTSSDTDGARINGVIGRALAFSGPAAPPHDRPRRAAARRARPDCVR